MNAPSTLRLALLLALSLPLVACPELGDDDDAVADDDDSDPSLAQAFIYAHGPTTLYEIEPDSPYTATSLGEFVGSDQVTDLAIDGEGRMWAVSFSQVFEVDVSTRQLTERWSEPTLTSMNAMTFLADGTLLAGALNQLYEVDTTSGELTALQSLGTYVFAGDMVGLPDGLLYMLMCSDGTADCAETLVVAMDLDTGDYWEVGPTGYGSMWGVAYHDGNGLLYGFNAAGQTLLVDPTDGSAIEGAAGGAEWWGATTNPARWEG